MDTTFEPNKMYTQKEVISKDFLDIHTATFHKHYMSDKDFPTPYGHTARSGKYKGGELNRYFERHEKKHRR